MINALVSRDGLTVIWRLGDVPLLGQTNITLEATVYGAVLGLRAVALVLIATLYSVAVDPDEVLRLFRGLLLQLRAERDDRDAHGAGAGARLPPPRGGAALPAGRRRRAGRSCCGRRTAGVLDRALDVAATLEVRGYGAARQRARGGPHRRRERLVPPRSRVPGLGCRSCWQSPWSRGSPAGRRSTAYPLLRAPAGARTLERGGGTGCWSRWRRSPTGGGSSDEPRLDRAG